MLTQARLRDVLHYEPSTGVFTWRKAPRLKGVYLRVYPSGSVRYLAKMNVGTQQVHLGTFHSPAEAHQAYKAAVRQRHGAFAGV